MKKQAVEKIPLTSSKQGSFRSTDRLLRFLEILQLWTVRRAETPVGPISRNTC